MKFKSFFLYFSLVTIFLSNYVHSNEILPKDLELAKKNTREILNISKSFRNYSKDIKSNQSEILVLKNKLKEMLDLETFINSSIAIHKKELKDNYYPIRKILYQMFEHVFQVNLGENLVNAEIEIGSPGLSHGYLYDENGEKSLVKWIEITSYIYIEEEDMELDIGIIWSKDHKVIDIIFDGSSLVNDYKNQFGKFIKKYNDHGKKLRETLQKKRDKLLSKN